jgi:hypothetical protein
MISETKQTSDGLWPDSWKAQELPLLDASPQGAARWTRLPEDARKDFHLLLARLRQDWSLSGAMDEELLGKYAWVQFLLSQSIDTTTDLLSNPGAEWNNDEALALLRRQTRFQSRYQRKAERLHRWILQSQGTGRPDSSHRKRTPLQSSWKTFRRCSRNLRAAQLTATWRSPSGCNKNYNPNQSDSKQQDWKELLWKTTTSTS